MLKQNIYGFTSLLLASFLYSTYGVFSRIIGDNIDPFYQYSSRSLIIIVFILGVAFWSKNKMSKVNPKHYKWIILQGLSAGALTPTFYLAVNKLPLGTTMFLFYALSTIVSYLLGRLVHNEQITRVKLVSFVLALAGLFLMSIETFRINNPLYVSYALISGIFFGLNLTSVKVINKEYSGIQVNLFSWVGVFVTNFIVALVLAENLVLPTISTPWLANMGLAAISFGASMSAIIGFKYIELQKGSIILLSELVFVVILGWILYGEIPTLFLVIGGTLIIAALLLPNLRVFTKKAFQES